MTYALGIYLLNLLIASLSPKIDPATLDEDTGDEGTGVHTFLFSWKLEEDTLMAWWSSAVRHLMAMDGAPPSVPSSPRLFWFMLTHTQSPVMSHTLKVCCRRVQAKSLNRSFEGCRSSNSGSVRCLSCFCSSVNLSPRLVLSFISRGFLRMWRLCSIIEL